MKDLHHQQRKLLEILRANIDDPLTFEELKSRLGISSKSVVFYHIQQLKKKGFLKRNPNNPRDYIILTDPEKAVVYINHYGLTECGPEGSILDGNPIDRIPIASRLISFPSNEAFIVKAKGESMLPRIKPGDYIIAQKNSHCEDGNIVICVNDGMAIVKQVKITNKGIVLHSLNSEKNPPFPAKEDFRVEGIVKSIIHYD